MSACYRQSVESIVVQILIMLPITSLENYKNPYGDVNNFMNTQFKNLKILSIDFFHENRFFWIMEVRGCFILNLIHYLYYNPQDSGYIAVHTILKQ